MLILSKKVRPEWRLISWRIKLYKQLQGGQIQAPSSKISACCATIFESCHGIFHEENLAECWRATITARPTHPLASDLNGFKYSGNGGVTRRAIFDAYTHLFLLPLWRHPDIGTTNQWIGSRERVNCQR